MPNWTKEQMMDYENRRALRRGAPQPFLKPEPVGWTDDECARLREAYADPDGVSLSVLSVRFGRSEASLACKANELGLTSPRGKFKRSSQTKHEMSLAQKDRFADPAERTLVGVRVKQWHSVHDHPRGMLGKHHTQKTKDAISSKNLGRLVPPEQTARSMRTRLAIHGTLAPALSRGHWKAEWLVIGGVRSFYRSRWEANYARLLDWQKTQGLISGWEHEPDTFWFDGIQRGVRSYRPDFKLVTTDGSVEYHEVKGWMDPQSRTKLRRMAIYHPQVRVVLIDSERYRSLKRTMAAIVPGWV